LFLPLYFTFRAARRIRRFLKNRIFALPLIRRFFKNQWFGGLLRHFLCTCQHSANSYNFGRLKYLRPETEKNGVHRTETELRVARGAAARPSPSPPRARVPFSGFVLGCNPLTSFSTHGRGPRINAASWRNRSRSCKSSTKLRSLKRLTVLVLRQKAMMTAWAVAAAA